MLVLLLGTMLTLSANPITKAEARQVAQEFIGIDDASTDDVPVAPYYVFSRGEGRGYVIVSGDDSTTPIIGYTEQGDFVEEELPEPLRDMLASWANRIGQVQAKPQAQGPRRSVRERLLTARRGVEAFKESWVDVPVMCQTHWHQSAPYNNLAPVNPENTSQRAVTGCVATAASQIIYYFHKDNPDTLIYDTPTYSYGYPVTESLPKGTPIEYDQMKLSGSGTARQNKAVATLMYAIGTCSYLTYGSSTGGQPDQCGQAMKGQFWLDNDYHGKWEYSQQGWEKLIYNSLTNGSPMLYGATSTDKTSGHAVVLDGYQARTGLYHFNFGWGGQGDGWYTVDDETGMNGFPYDQRGCMNFSPRKPNLKGTLMVNGLYYRTTSKLKAEVENNGTLKATNFALYVSTNGKLPSSASGTDKNLVLAPGEKGTVEFSYRPSSRNKIYLFLCDAKKNILDSCSMDIQESVPDLTLQKISVDQGSSTTEVDGMTFGMVNNSTATVNALLTNSAEGTPSQPSVKCFLYSYDRDTKEWTEATHLTLSNEIFETDETRNVKFAFRNLTEGVLYKAFLDHEVRATALYELKYNTADTAVYFTVRPADFAMTIDGRTAVATGRWNSGLFQNAAGDASVTSYDLTGVSELNEKPVVDNPNAIFYTNTPIAGATNVVVGNQCESLVVVQDYDFLPAKAFTANEAKMVLSVNEPAIWGDAFVPFAVAAPMGMQMKQLTGVATVSMTSNTTRNVAPMSAIVYMVDRPGINELKGSNVEIGTDSIFSAVDSLLLSSSVETGVTAKELVIGYKKEVAYFLPVAEGTSLLPFHLKVNHFSSSGYRVAPVTESRYAELAGTLAEAYDLMNSTDDAPADALQALMDCIAESEEMFSNVTASQASEVRDQILKLQAAMQAFRDAIATGIETITTSDVQANGRVEYFNLSGMRLQKPERGIVIVKQGNSVKKVLVK